MFFALAIFLIGLTSGFLPIKIAKKHTRLLSVGDAFASGVFLSAGLLHMLPDAAGEFQKIFVTTAYPYAQLICVFTFILLLLIEHGALIATETHMRNHITPYCNHVTPYLLAIVLSVHSIIAGAALGISTNLFGTLFIFFAIIAHKGSAGFALSTNLQRYFLTIQQIRKMIIIFALATPCGIIIASFIKTLLQMNSACIVEAIFNACAAGTFLYLGTVHIVLEPKKLQHWEEAVSLVAGVFIMAVVAIWL